MGAAGFRTAALALVCVGCTSIAADARTFEGTRWHATAIDGRSTPMTGNYVIRFDKGRIGGLLGCNLFGGEYRVRGEVITASAIRSTMMACMEPAASFEGQGFAVLNQPMRMRWASGRKLTLSNGAGSIDLELLR
jgi:heat shock protein HslJ